MTLVTGTVQDLGHDGMEGTLWARPARFRSDGQVVLAPERKPFKITGGVVSAELAPGPAVLELQVGSHARGTFEVVIPDTDISLADLLDTVFAWEPAQVSLFVAEREAAEQAKADAETAAQVAEGHRQHVDDIRETLDEAAQGNVAPYLTQTALNATYATKDELSEVATGEPAEITDAAVASALTSPGSSSSTAVKGLIVENSSAVTGAAYLDTDGLTDAGAEINALFATLATETDTPEVRLPANRGDLPLSTTVFIPAGGTLVGAQGTRLVLQDGYTLTRIEWVRMHPDAVGNGIYPMVANVVPPTGQRTTGVTIRDLTLVGSQTDVRRYLTAGILFADAEDCQAVNCQADYINFDDSYTGYGWFSTNLMSTRVRRVRWENCRASWSGYENFGAWDDSRDVDWINCWSGPAWRTGFQIHRDCSDLRVNGLVVRQNYGKAHSAVTIHGENGVPVERVRLDNIDIDSTVDATQPQGGAIQIVGYTTGLRSSGLRAWTNNFGMYIHETCSDFAMDDWRMTSAKDALICYGADVRLSGFDLTTDGTATGNTVAVGPQGARFNAESGVIARRNGNGAVFASGSGATDLSLSNIRIISTNGNDPVQVSNVVGRLILDRIVGDTTGGGGGVLLRLNQTMANNGMKGVVIRDCDLTAPSGKSCMYLSGPITGARIQGNKTRGSGIGYRDAAAVVSPILVGNDFSESGTPTQIASTTPQAFANLPAA